MWERQIKLHHISDYTQPRFVLDLQLHQGQFLRVQQICVAFWTTCARPDLAVALPRELTNREN